MSKNGNSRVIVDLNNPADGSKGNSITNVDGTSGRPAEIGLAHELIHADNNAKGNVDGTLVQVINPDKSDSEKFPNAIPQGGVGTTTQDELNVRGRENAIRDEQDVTKRAEVKKVK